MPPVPSTSERCRLLLAQWRSGLTLSNRERGLLGGQLLLHHDVLRFERGGRYALIQQRVSSALIEQPWIPHLLDVQMLYQSFLNLLLYRD